MTRRHGALCRLKRSKHLKQRIRPQSGKGANLLVRGLSLTVQCLFDDYFLTRISRVYLFQKVRINIQRHIWNFVIERFFSIVTRSGNSHSKNEKVEETAQARASFINPEWKLTDNVLECSGSFLQQSRLIRHCHWRTHGKTVKKLKVLPFQSDNAFGEDRKGSVRIGRVVRGRPRSYFRDML